MDLHHYAVGSGVFLARTSRAADALWWSWHGGPLREVPHGFADCGGLLIYVNGAWLLRSSNMNSHSGINYRSPHHNVAQFGAYQQSGQYPSTRWPKEAGVVLEHTVTPERVTLVTDLAQAFVQDRAHTGFAVLESYTRRVVFLPRVSAWVVVDRWQRKADKLEGDTVIRWHGGREEPIVVGNGFQLQGHPTHYLRGEAYGGASGAVVESFRLGPDTDPATPGVQSAITSYAATIHVPPSAAPQQVITVLQAVPVGITPHPVAYDGQRVTVGTETVEV